MSRTPSSLPVTPAPVIQLSWLANWPAVWSPGMGAPPRPNENSGTSTSDSRSTSVAPWAAQLFLVLSTSALNAALEKPRTARTARPRPAAPEPTLVSLRVREVVVITRCLLLGDRPPGGELLDGTKHRSFQPLCHPPIGVTFRYIFGSM